MENILMKKEKSFKVKNTWSLFDSWDEGGMEKFYTKLFTELKSILKEENGFNRVKKCYIDQTDENAIWFCCETKDKTFKVSLYRGNNINGGTWFTICDIKVENNFVEQK